MDQLEEISPDAQCCANCRFWDKRTSFCRFFPPQVITQYVNRMVYPQAAWPKIQMPTLDWCSQFERNLT